MASHRTQRLKIFGEAPEVEKLFGSRYRIVVRAEMSDKTEDWYYANKSRIFADFGSLYSAEMAIDGIEAHDGEAYPNARLVSHAAEYLPTGKYVVRFVYETLTEEFVQEAADKVDHELNGLRRVTRPVIAKDGTSYGKTVGTSSIIHTAHGYGSATLYLASAVEAQKPANEDGYVRIVETWLEPGIISERVRLFDGGLRQVSRESFYEKNAPAAGILVDETKTNFNGYPVWSTVTIQSSSGGDPTSGTAQEYTTYVPFQYPGVANAVNKTILTGFEIYDVELDAPITVDVEATVQVTYQSGSSIGSLPHTYWNPDSWVKLEAVWLTSGREPTSVYKTIPNYRAGSTTEVTYDTAVPKASFLGRFIYTVGTDGDGTITLSEGPEDPEGNTYVIQRPKLEEAFVDKDGTKYYRKTVVFATIPSRS